MSPHKSTTSGNTPARLRRAARELRRRAERAVAAVSDGIDGLLSPGAPRRQPGLVPIPVRSPGRPRRA